MMPKLILSLFLILLIPTAYASHGEIDVTIDTLQPGNGAEALRFSVVEVHYSGKLVDGSEFDSSLARGEPIRFTLSAGQVIPGWDMGILGMKVGEKRRLTIPPELAYGQKGAGAKIPPNATLIFEVELVGVTPPPFNSISNEQLATKLKNGAKIIDIRRIEEWKETGVIAGSVESTAFDSQGRFLPAFLEQLKQTVEPDEEFVVICRTGNRTALLSNWLATKGGYKNVLNVKDGITAWIAEGKPVSKSGS